MGPQIKLRSTFRRGKSFASISAVLFAILLFPQSNFSAPSNQNQDVNSYSTNNESTECFKPPDGVPIKCRLENVNVSECLRENVISVPNVFANLNGTINCTSPRPLDISFVGFQLNDFVKTNYVRNAANVFNEATYVFSVSIAFSQIRASREVVVTSHGSVDLKTRFFIFRPGDEIFSSNLRPHASTAAISPSESLLIPFLEKKLELPCIPNDPNITPKLSPNNSHVIFEKTKGFIIDTNYVDPVGHYECEAMSMSENKQEHVSFTVEPVEETIFEPKEDKVYFFENSEVKVLCKCKDVVKLEGKFRDGSIENTQMVSLTVSDTSIHQYVAKFEAKYVKVGDKASVECKTSNGTLLKKWDIEVVDFASNPVLSLKKTFEEQVICQSQNYSSSEIKLQAIFCQGQRECKMNEFCFDEENAVNSTCPKKVTGKPCSKNTEAVEAGSLCLTLPQNDTDLSQGTIRCTAGGTTYQTNYFRGFDQKLYLDWQEAPLSALIDIIVPTNVTMYPHNSYPFGCKAISFISDGKLQWVIRGKDGSEILLHETRVQDLYNVYATELDYRLYTVRESNIRLIYPNDYDVICMVPKWNETGWVRHHKRINVAAKVAPVAEIVSAAAVVILILIGTVIFVMWRLKKAKDAIRNLTEKEVLEFHEGNPEALKNAADKEAHEVVDSLPYDQKFEIPREKLLIDSENILGKGAFGTVLKGRVEGISDVVAVKTVNNDCEVNRFKGFLSELKIMIYIGKHPFIVSLIGASTEKIKEKTLYIVVEFCSNGSLEGYLRKYRNCFADQIVDNEICNGLPSYENAPSPSNSLDKLMTTIDFIRWSYQIANGMEYLAAKKVVHADLAARNVLIDSKGNTKITDFGLSRQLFDYTQYVKKQQEPLPWRWMAIESLQQLRFSSKSDVWAYGVLLWEIYSLGDIPYPGLSWDINFVQQLTGGLRLIKPPYCTSGIYNLMLDCWQEDPDTRPGFSHHAQYFQSLLETLNVELEATKETPMGNNYNNGSVLIPGYLKVSELAGAGGGDTVTYTNEGKVVNVYVNS